MAKELTVLNANTHIKNGITFEFSFLCFQYDQNSKQ